MNDQPTRQATLLTTANALGPIVRERRKSQSLRINDAAGLLGVSVDLMSRLENGQGTVQLNKAMAMLDGLGLTLMVLPKEHPWAREASTQGGIDRKLLRREGQRLAKLAEPAAMAQAQAADYEEDERAFAQGIASFVAKQAKRLTQLVEDAARIKAEYL